MGLWSTRLNPTQPDSTRPDRTGSSRSPDHTTPDYKTGRRNKVDRAWTPVFGVCACRQRLILTRPNGQIDLLGQVSQAGQQQVFCRQTNGGEKKNTNKVSTQAVRTRLFQKHTQQSLHFAKAITRVLLTYHIEQATQSLDPSIGASWGRIHKPCACAWNGCSLPFLNLPDQTLFEVSTSSTLSSTIRFNVLCACPSPSLPINKSAQISMAARARSPPKSPSPVPTHPSFTPSSVLRVPETELAASRIFCALFFILDQGPLWRFVATYQRDTKRKPPLNQRRRTNLSDQITRKRSTLSCSSALPSIWSPRVRRAMRGPESLVFRLVT